MRKLPKTKYPLFEIKIPSTDQKVYYRQMIVSDEKILLVAKVSEDPSDIFRAVKQVVNNCIIDDIEIDDLSTFDIEYLFIKIRATSIGNVIEVAYHDSGDDSEYKFVIDLDKIEVNFPENISPNVKINDSSMVVLRYPPATVFDERDEVISSFDGYEYLASMCIKQIFDGDEVYEATDYTKEELVDFIQNLDTKTYGTIKEFLSNMPRLHYAISYENKQGVRRDLSLNTLTDFFTF